MSKPIEPLEAPAGEHAAQAFASALFIHRIRVRWADCDPASIAYAGQIPRFALEAIEAWWEHHVDSTGMRSISTAILAHRSCI